MIRFITIAGEVVGGFISFLGFGLVWFGLVLWHISHCRLFNAKSSLYTYIKYIGFGLV